MHELILWHKREMDKLRRDMDQLFRQFRREFGVPRWLFQVAESVSMEFSETENTLTIQAALPGIKPEDIHISVTEDTLTLKGESKADRVDEGEGYQRVERNRRSFSRTIPLPCRIETEEVEASYKDNILKIILLKCKPKEQRGVTIQIK